MSIGNQISAIRNEQQLTQEQFGELFHVTRQTVSNWENEKSYPDLQILIAMSNQFNVSLDTLLKGDSKMVEAIDKERVLGKIKHEKSLVGFFTSAGTGLVASCFLSSASRWALHPAHGRCIERRSHGIFGWNVSLATAW